MLTAVQIERLVATERYEHLIARVISGGRCPAACEMDLVHACRGAGAAPAALGLALQRLTELTYVPCPLARTLAARLIGLQRNDGLWAFGAASLAPSAFALRGLLDFDAQLDGRRAMKVRGLDEAIDRAARAIASLQRGDGSIGRGDRDAAIILWQLAAHPGLPIRFFDLRRAVAREQSGQCSPVRMEITRLACAAA
jgi:hypothetical protein